MAKLTLGYRPSGNSAGWGGGAFMSGVMRATTRAGHSKHLWITRVGGRVGTYDGDPTTMRLAVYSATANWTPNVPMGETAPFSVTVLMNDATSNAGGANYERALLAPIRLAARAPYALTALGYNGPWAHGQNHSGAIMYERGGLTSFPTPFTAASASPQGDMALWMVAWENVAPTIPLGTVSPRDGATTTDETPTIGIDFRDANEVLEGFPLGAGDFLRKYQIQVWNDARTAKLRDSGVLTATAGQQTARRATWTVPTDLAPGRYTVRAQVYDAFETPSAWREWKITIVGAGSVLVTTPEGLTNDPSPDLGWDYSHRQGLAMDRLVARITSPAGTIVRADVSVDLTPDAAAPSTGTLAWAATGWADLPAGADYRALMQAVDSDGQPSPWSAPLAFHVNAAPLMPASLSPAAGLISIAVPELSALVTDVDDAASTLAVTFTVRPQGGGAETSAPGIYTAATGRWTVPPVAAGLISTGAYGTYEWRVQATDPHGLASPATPWRAFAYVAPAVVTPVAPVGTIDASNPVFTWTVDRAQTAYRVQVWDDATGALVRNGDTGWVTSAETTHTFADLLLRNNQSVRARIDVITTGDIPGEVEWTFDVAYTPPVSVTGVTAEAVMADFDYPNAPSQILVTWDAVTSDAALFDGYLVRRRDLDTGVTETLALLSGLDHTAYVDDTAGSGVVYEYQVVQRVWQALDLLESLPAVAQASVTLRAAVLSVVLGGEGRAVLPYFTKVDVDPQWDKTVRRTWAAKARVLTGPQHYRRISAEFEVIGDQSGQGRFSARDLMAAVQDMGAPWVDEAGAVRDRVLCLRDQRGLVAYVSLLKAPASYRQAGTSYVMPLDMVETSFGFGGEG